jgi:lipoprotein-anchoring transpeptidase ErfK/SrfK
VVPAPPPTDAAALNPKKPRKFWIDGRLRELKKGEVRPYKPPAILPEPEAQPSAVHVFELAIPKEPEVQVLARPYYGSPMVGTVSPGTRMAVRGEVISQTGRSFCPSRKWLALLPFGWACADHGKPSELPPSSEPFLKVVPGERVPFRYIMVSAQEGIPMWTTLDALKSEEEPERTLEKGDSVAIEKEVRHNGDRYWQSVEGKVLPQKGTYQMSATSLWHGILIDEKMHLPFGWVLPETQKALAAPAEGKAAVALTTLKRRTRVDILEEQTIKGKRWLKVRLSAPPAREFPLTTAPLPPPAGAPVGAVAAPAPPTAPAAPAASAAPAFGAAPRPGVAAAPAAPAPAPAAGPGAPPGVRPPGPAPVGAPAAPGAAAAPGAPAAPAVDPVYWVPAWAVNEVKLRQRPAGTGTNPQWIDADLGEQVLVGYENEKPAWATLVSSGRNDATPLGIYPVWARVAAITMKSQPYDEKGYFVNMVPWSTFFQAHNAIHGAYWHDRFGSVKSHGCINVSPLDARFVFEWLKPELPFGWTSVRPVELTGWPTLYVHNTSKKVQFHQDRPIGPTDKADESERLEDEERRRAEQGLPSLAAIQAAKKAAKTPAPPGAPQAPVAPGTAPAPAPPAVVPGPGPAPAPAPAPR